MRASECVCVVVKWKSKGRESTSNDRQSVTGQEVQLPLDQALAGLRPSNNPEADDRIKRLKADLALARTNIERAQQRQSRYADEHRRGV